MSGNAEQLEYWNGPGGNRWVTHQKTLDSTIEAFGQEALRVLSPKTGERVLDVGCGAGTTSLRLAKAVGPKGRVVGLDLSEPMVTRARNLASDVSQAQFDCEDASTYQASQLFDALFSRFGVMFFSDPIAAFRNLRSALSPSGRMAFVCWQGRAQNEWIARPMDALLPLVTAPPAAPAPRSPGPFAFAERAYLQSVVSGAGFQNIEIQGFESPVTLSTTGLDAAVEFCLTVSPTARLSNAQPADVQQQMRTALAHALASCATGDHIALSGSSWVVTANA